uniref:Uncharacterized protein n=1 Tax=Molossus molossus TaxID=27622 RepID=A0A7J8CZP9_MOLMO|nr:hypothetical protein HJG59_009476 [Molossus molossus]
MPQASSLGPLFRVRPAEMRGNSQIQGPEEGGRDRAQQEGDSASPLSFRKAPATWRMALRPRSLNGTEKGGAGPEGTVVERAGWPEMGQCSFNRPLLQTLGGGEVAAPGDKRIRISKLCSNLGSWTRTLQGPSS